MKNFIPSLLAIMAMASPTLAGPVAVELDTPVPAAHLEARAKVCTVTAVDNLLFRRTLAQFHSARKAKNPSRCDWGSDGCSWSPDRPSLIYNFLPSCQRHDFGYSNIKKQKRWNKTQKKKVDNLFYADLKNYCNKSFRGIKTPLRPRCLVYAKIYYEAVKKFGKRDLAALESGYNAMEKRAEALGITEENVENFEDVDFDNEDFEGLDFEDVTKDDEFSDSD